MDVSSLFESFYNELKEKFLDNRFQKGELQDTIKNIESDFYPDVIKIVQRDASFFEKPRMMFSEDMSLLWNEGDDSEKDMIWKGVMMCSAGSFLNGDIKEKVGTLLETVKSLWSSSGQRSDEVDKVLNDEQSEDKIKELIDYVSELRTVKMLLKIAETVDVSDLGIDLEHPEELINKMKDPNSPEMLKIAEKAKSFITERITKGEITQQQMMSEFEGVKAKVMSMFGGMFTEMLGGKKGSLPASVLMGTSPEARRQRMLARLQKKQREKNSG